MRLYTKLLAGFLILVLFLLIGGGVSWFGIKAIKAGAEGIKFAAAYHNAILSTTITIIKQQDAITDYSLTQDKEVLIEIDKYGKDFVRNIEKLMEFAGTEREKESIKRLTTVHDSSVNVGIEIASAYKAGDKENGLVLMADFDSKVTTLERVIGTLTSAAMKIADENMAKNKWVQHWASTLIALGTLISIALGLPIALFVSRSISRPIVAVTLAMEKVAAGDLTAPSLPVKSHDEIGRLSNALNKMKENLNRIISQVKGTSSHIALATTQLAATATRIVGGADRQSTQANQVATFMEEMSATVMAVARHSQNAADSANTTQEIAVNGGEVVSKTIEGMMAVADTVKTNTITVETLRKSSNQIGSIIAVINDIADQTNLLALNASIEAARAGEHGRGFAVVANEVHQLAEKTTHATKEIAEMIQTIQEDTRHVITSMHDGTKQVEEGVTLSNEAGNALRQIVASVDEVTEMAKQIAVAAKQQSVTTDEITTNVAEIATISNETAEGIKQVSSATNGLSKVTKELKAIVGSFILQENTGKEVDTS